MFLKILNQTDEINPYIAFTDLMINLVLILIFFIVSISILGKVGWEQVRYKDIQEQVKKSIKNELGDFMFDIHPIYQIPMSKYRNDPPGAQRWVIYAEKIFEKDSYKLTSEGKTKLEKLANALLSHHNQMLVIYGTNDYLNHTWRRIRIEGHTKPTQIGQKENWQLSAMRAANVADILTGCGIQPWFISISARGGQTPFDKNLPPNDNKHERIEIILEYSPK